MHGAAPPCRCFAADVLTGLETVHVTGPCAGSDAPYLPDSSDDIESGTVPYQRHTKVQLIAFKRLHLLDTKWLLLAGWHGDTSPLVYSTYVFALTCLFFAQMWPSTSTSANLNANLLLKQRHAFGNPSGVLAAALCGSEPVWADCSAGDSLQRRRRKTKSLLLIPVTPVVFRNRG